MKKAKRTGRVVEPGAEDGRRSIDKGASLPREAGSLAELNAAVQRESLVRVRLGPSRAGQEESFDVRVRRLRPAEAEELENMLDGITPPMAKRPNERGELVEVFDLQDPEYLKKHRRRMRECRALALYWCCPIFNNELRKARAEGAGEPSIEEIRVFVEGQLTDGILEELYSAARAMDVEVIQHLGF